MPRIDVVFFQENDRSVPVLDWLTELRKSDSKAYESCVAAIHRLAELGHEMRRPLADFLTDGIYELRIRKGHVNYRLLYFFHGRNLAILSHALTKEDRVPGSDMARAVRRKRAFQANPDAHTYSHEEEIT